MKSERGLHYTVQGGLSEQHAVETPSPWSSNLLGAPFYLLWGSLNFENQGMQNVG